MSMSDAAIPIIIVDLFDKNSAARISIYADEIDTLGVSSAKAQSLNGPITTTAKLLCSDHKLLVALQENSGRRCIGYIKFGKKRLFFYSPSVVELECECVLDFFVSDDVQRVGVGIKLFNRMLQEMRHPHPSSLAYDRPSPLLLNFLRKHFLLSAPDLQPNRFAIFEGFKFVR